MSRLKPQPPARVHRRSAAAIAALAVFLLSGCEDGVAVGNIDGNDATANPQQTKPEAPARRAKVLRVARSSEASQQRLVAKVLAAQTIDLAFEVSGALIDLPVREGQQVKRGGLLARLQQNDFRLAVQEAEVQLRLKRNDFERKQALLQRRGISRSVVDDARAEADLAQVRLNQTREALAKSTLRAPFDAYVAQRMMDNHTNVQAAMPIVRLLDLQKLHLQTSVPEALLANLTATDFSKATATFSFIPGKSFPVTYLEHRGEADNVAQTYDVTFALDPPEGYNLLPGMTANVLLEFDQPDAMPLQIDVPASAIVTDAERNLAVWVLDQQSNKVWRQTVTAEPAPGGLLRVTEGLSGGELIVTTGTNLLQPGMSIVALDE